MASFLFMNSIEGREDYWTKSSLIRCSIISHLKGFRNFAKLVRCQWNYCKVKTTG